MEWLTEFLRSPYFGLFSTVFGVAVGAVVTWYVARIYYLRASLELRQEAERLRTKTDLVLYCLTNPDVKVDALRNEKGEVTGISVPLSGKASFGFKASGTLSAGNYTRRI